MASHRYAAVDTPKAAVSRNRSDLATTSAKKTNALTMVKKLIKGSNTKSGNTLKVPADPIAKDLKKDAAKNGSGFSGLHRKLFQKGDSADRKPLKALTEKENKQNTRTLAMVLRSERELIGRNKEYADEVLDMQIQLEEKNREMEMLKDLCLKQRGEIKALKDALLFPDVMNLQLERMLERRGSAMKEKKEKEIIPVLQQQVSSLNGQLQWLKEELSEVKAEKYSGRKGFVGRVSPSEARILDNEFANSLDYSSGNPIENGFGSPDDTFLDDYNPCLTPYSTKNKSKEFDDFSPLWSRRTMTSNSHEAMIYTGSGSCERR